MILDRSSLLFGMLRSLVSTILVCGSAKEAFSHLHRDGSISLQRAVRTFLRSLVVSVLGAQLLRPTELQRSPCRRLPPVSGPLGLLAALYYAVSAVARL